MRKLILIWMLGFLCNMASAQQQPVTQQWHTSITSNAPTANTYDWIWSVIQTERKEYIATGYTRHEDALLGINVIVPCFMKLDHTGKPVWIKKVLSATGINLTCVSCTTANVLSNKGGHLWSVTEFITPSGAHHFMATGYIRDNDNKSVDLLVEFDEAGNTLNQTPIAFEPVCPSTDIAYGMSFYDAKPRSIAIDENSNDILITGEVMYKDNGDVLHRFLQVSKIPYANGMITNFTATTRVLGNDGGTGNFYRGGNSAYKIITRPTSGSTYDIFLSGYKSSMSTVDEDNQKFTDNSCTIGENSDVWKMNKDIWLLKLDQDLDVVLDRTYTKGDLPALQYFNTGPLTARDLDNVSPVTAISCVPDVVTDNLKASVNNDERGVDITFTSDGNLAMTALINRIAVLGQPGFQDDNGHSMINGNTDGLDAVRFGVPYHYASYIDGDLFLLRIDAGNGDLMVDGAQDLSKNLGHFSSREFHPRVIQNCNDEFIIAGSTADYYDGSDPDLTTPDKYDIFLVATDDNTFSPNHKWRRALHSEDEGGVCIMTMAKTADDGFIIAGDNDMNNDNFSFTKFAPPYAPELTYDITDPTGVYYLGSSNETWDVDKKVNAKVIVQSGETLTINDGAVISFASSDHIYDFNQFADDGSDGLKIGIVVQPGGTLVVDHATLRGIAYTPCSSATNNRFMWDGIVIQGTPNAAQTSGNQGTLLLSGATIKDARFAAEIADARRSFFTTPPSTYTNTIGTTYSFEWKSYGSKYYELGAYGGGMVTAEYSKILDCYGGIKYQKYPTVPSIIISPQGNTGYFNSNDFESENPLADICEFPGKDGAGQATAEFLSGWRVKGIQVLDNSFSCSACSTYNFHPVDRPTGINLYDAGMVIDRHCIALNNWGNCVSGAGAGNAFRKLKTGIQAIFSSPLYNAPLLVRYNNFDQNGDGMLISGSIASLTVSNNNILVPDDAEYTYPTGITLKSCKSYSVLGNTFGHCTACSTAATGARGIVVNNGHDNNEIISLNLFNNLQYPSIALQRNGENPGGQNTPGLQFKCNQYYAYDEYAIRRMKYDAASNTTATPTLRTYQGNCVSGNLQSPAGNQFWNTVSASDERLFTDDLGTGSQEVIYNNNEPNTEYDPDYPSTGTGSNYVNNSCNTNPGSWAAACPQPSFGYGTGSGQVLKGVLSTLDSLMEAVGEEDESYATLVTERWQTVSELARNYAALRAPDSAAALLEQYGRYDEAFGFYLQAGMPENAYYMLSLLPQDTQEEIDFASLASLSYGLALEGQDWEDMDDEGIEILYTIAAPNSLNGAFAAAALAQLGIQPFVWPRPEVSESGKPGNNAGNAGNEAGSALMSLYPNPTNGNFTIYSSKPGEIMILNLQGQVLSSYLVKEGRNEMKMPNVSAGIYLGSFRTNGEKGKPAILRIIYQP